MKEDSKKQFINIIQSHQGVINSICRIYFTTPEDQKDGRQEIILQLWKAFPNFRGDSKWSTWIYKIALNTVLSQLRKKHIVSTRLPDITWSDIPARMGTDDDFQQLQHFISLLRAKDKALVILYLEGYHHQEIAITLGISVSNVSTRLNRIKKKLQTIYKKYTHETK